MDIPTKEELLSNIADPKILPFVAKKVLDLVADENASIHELSDTIERDQSISSKILKIANSPLYGLRQEVTSLRQAILVLGLNSIKDLVITVTTKSQYKRFGITERMMWDHSVGAAISARFISERFCAGLGEFAFLGGLLHDFGKVLMNNESPDAYVEVMMKTYNDGLDSITAERNVFGYDHTEIGSLVVAEWGFPSIYSEIMSKHHLEGEKLQSIEDRLAANAVASVNLADHICKRLGIGYRGKDEDIDLAALPSAEFLGIKAAALEILTVDVEETFNKESSAFY